nr:hypothetical protein [uncultured Sulfurimonas sp.]
MKNLILMILLSFITLYAQSFNNHNILGVWEVSSLKLNGFTTFGKDNSKNRGEAYTLIFSKNNKVKNKTTGTIYNYEILNNGQLEIYKIKTYKSNYKMRDNIHYDTFKTSGTFENCQVVKITKKKITGYYRKEGYKWCKVQDYPKATFYVSEDYDF